MRWLGSIVAVLVLLLCLAWFWLLHTNPGARFAIAQAEDVAGFSVATVDGSIAGGLRVADLHFANDSADVRVRDVAATIDVGLLPLAITIMDAAAADIAVEIIEDDKASGGGGGVAATLESLVLPFPVQVEAFHATNIAIARGDVRETIDRLAISATWYETIEIHRLSVDTRDLEAEAEATLDLQQGNAVTTNVTASLKPSMTRTAEPVAVRLRSIGDLAGAEVFASVDEFAKIDARVSWQGGLEAVADVTVDALDLSGIVDNWPVGFPVDGKLHAAVNDVEFTLTDSEILIGTTDSRIVVDARMQRGTGTISGRLRWQRLRWPLPETETRVRSDAADLQLAGTVDDWTAAGTIGVAAEDLPAGGFRIDARGDRDSARGRIVDSEVLGGHVAGEVSYTWRDPRPWLATLDLTNVHLEWLLPEWPAIVSGRFDSRGTGRPFAMHASLAGIYGELRGLPLRADGVVDIESGNVVLDELHVVHGESQATLNGALMAPQGLSFDATIADLSVYVDGTSGSVKGAGSISLADGGEFLDATLASPDLWIGDLGAANVDAVLRASGETQRLNLSAEYLGTTLAIALDGAFDDWRRPLDTGFAGRIEAFEIDLGDEHSMRLAGPAAFEFAAGDVTLGEFCVEDRIESRLCVDASWQRNGDYGINLDLMNVSVAVIEHALDSPLLFDQRVSGTFEWQHRFGAGPRGSGRLTLSPGTIAPFDDPTNGVATSDGALDFEIEQGRLLRGNVVLPFPGRGEVSGDFSVADVRLGAASGVTGNLDVDLSSIRTLSRLTNLVDTASGSLRARVNLAGTVADPKWSGNLALDNGTITYAPVGLDLTEVNLDGAMDSDFRFDVSGTFRAGKGTGEIVSRADFSNADEPGLVFRLRGDQLTLVNVPDVFVEADVDVDIGLDRETLTINGEVTVPNAHVKPTNVTGSKMNESNDVVIVAGELPDPPEEKPARSEFDYRGELNVALGNSVVVDLDLARANVTGAVNFAWQGDPMPIANGRYLINGTVEALGQVLDISEGSIHFPKVPADQPLVRIMAEREIYGNTQVKRAGVLIDGPIRRPTVEAYTQPLTTEERALTLLVTGSDFDYEQGVGGIDFGTYIAPRLFVSYGIGVFERENIISARFDLSKKFGIKASSGSKESGVDLNYRFEN